MILMGLLIVVVVIIVFFFLVLFVPRTKHARTDSEERTNRDDGNTALVSAHQHDGDTRHA